MFIPALTCRAFAGGSGDDGGIIGSEGQTEPAVLGEGGASLTGHVFTYAGAPIEGASVTVESLDDPPSAIPEMAVMTNGAGQFSWPLPEGTYKVTVLSPAGARKSRTATVQQGKARDLRFWLPH